MITFLVLALVGGLVLVAMIDQAGKRGRGGSRRGRGGGIGGGGGRGHQTSNAQYLNRDQIATRWATIQAMTADGGGNGLRQAVSEADKLLDQALRQSGVSGDTMGERLKAASRRFSDINSIWRAHKLRNALAHEIGFDLVPSQAKEALRDFERGLRDLGVL